LDRNPIGHSIPYESLTIDEHYSWMKKPPETLYWWIWKFAPDPYWWMRTLLKTQEWMKQSVIFHVYG
jgi:hypothetical protein